MELRVLGWGWYIVLYGFHSVPKCFRRLSGAFQRSFKGFRKRFSGFPGIDGVPREELQHVADGFLSVSMHFSEFRWVKRCYRGISWRLQRISGELTGLLGGFIKVHRGVSEKFQAFQGFSWCFKGFQGNSKVNGGFTGFHRVSFKAFQWVHGISKFLVVWVKFPVLQEKFQRSLKILQGVSLGHQRVSGLLRRPLGCLRGL